MRHAGSTERGPLTHTPPLAAVDLYWIPLGAGGHSVRLNGKVFEAAVSLVERRRPLDLYHAALVVHVTEGRYTIESTSVPSADAQARGAVAGGPVGSRWAGRFRVFRYEIRCWLDGVIPDLDEAVESPQRLTQDAELARRVLELTPHVPTPVWGRDEFEAGDVELELARLLAPRSQRDRRGAGPDAGGGRAPGWDAGVAVARRRA